MIAIKKVIKINSASGNENASGDQAVSESKSGADDRVKLSWFDMQKPNLTALSDKNVNFIVKAKFTHLHDHDVLVCDDGYTIEVTRGEDELYILEFADSLSFANNAYTIGNRHQPVRIEDLKITVLDDISLADIISHLEKDPTVRVTKMTGYFKPNGKAHHSH